MGVWIRRCYLWRNCCRRHHEATAGSGRVGEWEGTRLEPCGVECAPVVLSLATPPSSLSLSLRVNNRIEFCGRPLRIRWKRPGAAHPFPAISLEPHHQAGSLASCGLAPNGGAVVTASRRRCGRTKSVLSAPPNPWHRSAIRGSSDVLAGKQWPVTRTLSYGT